MVRSIGAQVALLAFGVATLAGLIAGNSPATVLTRALVALVVGLIVGQGAAWAGKLVIRDHLQRKKHAIDHEHFEASQAVPPAPPEPLETQPAEVG